MPLCCNFSLCVIHNAEETIINQEQFILSGAENLLVKVSHDVVAFGERINLLSQIGFDSYETIGTCEQ